MRETVTPSVEIKSVRLIKRHPVTKEPFEIIERNESGLKIWRKPRAAHEHRP